jgi:TetR/AcrR family transcriptional repressor of nem operon
MRVSNEEKERSRERILAAAGRLFRERGIEGASVGDIMGAAGMTHGGFYRHFASKEDLLAAALAKAFAAFARPLSEAPSGETAQAFRARYLSQAHRAAPGEGCPAAALGADVAREKALRELSMMVGATVLARACPDDLAAEILAACAARPA